MIPTSCDKPTRPGRWRTPPLPRSLGSASSPASRRRPVGPSATSDPGTPRPVTVAYRIATPAATPRRAEVSAWVVSGGLVESYPRPYGPGTHKCCTGLRGPRPADRHGESLRGVCPPRSGYRPECCRSSVTPRVSRLRRVRVVQRGLVEVNGGRERLCRISSGSGVQCVGDVAADAAASSTGYAAITISVDAPLPNGDTARRAPPIQRARHLIRLGDHAAHRPPPCRHTYSLPRSSMNSPVPPHLAHRPESAGMIAG
ncbi:Uncharacterised protein [Mycobacteroides abscessus subsp. abscessus]|nr:Uncharacterised protein [Mycobacteroides abscessus subsp. abscessus]SHW32898.1 Uncharacterised protein [Mycobacteroides abscessus subsp. abscessus]SIF91745.1 Uncharacterised protein [Mycobacteroides abscessus subsp. abscessus]SKD17758.1 Uncharacterised protein [Mycobacteroides abscessus subsp. abscessus]SKM23090.1 Uncharacterised protein [Mycobacteroides abscessus subsp. abscessus]